jgi:hypothetical protein
MGIAAARAASTTSLPVRLPLISAVTSVCNLKCVRDLVLTESYVNTIYETEPSLPEPVREYLRIIKLIQESLRKDGDNAALTFEVQVSITVLPKPSTILPASTSLKESPFVPAAETTAPMNMKIEHTSDPLVNQRTINLTIQ